MITAIDWTLDREAFRQQVERMIGEATFGHEVIPLPLLGTATAKMDLAMLITLLSQINCSQCRALCCKPGARPEEGVVSLTEQEFQKLGHHWSSISETRLGRFYDMPLPCPFLNIDDRCTIYNDRPLVCLFFPIDTGECDNEPVCAVQASCPEARRIAARVYLTAYELRKKVREMGKAPGEVLP